VYDAGVPVLDLYGAKLVAQQLGGEVARSGVGEYGRTGSDLVNERRCCSTLSASRRGVDEPRRLDRSSRRQASA